MANPISKLNLVINGVTTQLDVHDANALPTGSYIQFAGSQAPEGFLVCNGGEISRTTYSALFAVIGTTYGSGDGSTTFNLPNLTDRFLQGSTSVGTVKDAGLPNIEGYTSSGAMYFEIGTNGALTGRNSNSNRNLNTYEVSYKYANELYFNASDSNSIYGNSTTVQPPALTCLICIKY
jgi:microcystin-dependent protein